MCVGISVIVVPPLTLLGGYACWCAGEQFTLHRVVSVSSTRTGTSEPQHGIVSYGTGLATLYGSYELQFPWIQKYEASSSKIRQAVSRELTPPHKLSNPYQPPQTPKELWETLGRSLVSRFAAGSIAFFCAGTVQTFVAAQLDSRDSR
jgi:hypothetical protein